MTIDDIIAMQTDSGGEKCAVCGKSVAGGQAQARRHHSDQMVLLCCPLCSATFDRSPDDYIRRQRTTSEVRAIFELLRPKPAAVP